MQINRFESVYRQHRNKIRRLERHSLVKESLKFLQHDHGDKLTQVRHFPWLVLLILKWSFQDKLTHNKAPSKVATHNELRKIVNYVWDMADVMYDPANELPSSRLLMRQILNVQIKFQLPEGLGFIREAALLNSLESNHNLRTRFESATGLALNDFIDFCFIFRAAVLEGQLNFNPWRTFSMVGEHINDVKIDRFVNLISRDIDELDIFFNTMRKKRVVSELYEFPAVSRYPFLKHGNVLHCWQPSVLYWGISELVSNVLCEDDPQIMGNIGKLFEKHCLALAQELPVSFYTDKEMLEHLPKDCRNPDGLLAFGETNVYIEVKAGVYRQSALATGNSEILTDKLKPLFTAIDQATIASSELHKNTNTPTLIRRAQTEYLLVITNKELVVGNAKQLMEMLPQSVLAQSLLERKSNLTISNIYILSIDEYERLLQACRQKIIHLPDFLAECVSLDKDPSTSMWLLGQHLDRVKVPYMVSEIVKNEYDTCVGRLQQKLNTFV